MYESLIFVPVLAVSHLGFMPQADLKRLPFVKPMSFAEIFSPGDFRAYRYMEI